MKGLRNRRSLVALAVVILAAGATAATFALTRGGERDAGAALAAKVDKISKIHLDKFLSDPDQRDTAGHANLASPASWAEQQIRNLAYPSNTISASEVNAVRNAYLNHYAGSHATNPAASWNLVGPTTSTQPAVLNSFDGYIDAFDSSTDTGFAQNDFQVSGRDTAIALNTSTCNDSSCQAWVAAAGGGIWENDNILDSNSPWTFESASFGSNNIGTLVYNSRNHTLYAGTGEPNISADSGAGVGIYVSHNLGHTWSLLPGSPSKMNNRAVSSIAFTNSANTFYVGTVRSVHGVTATSGGAVSITPGAPQVGLYKTTNGGLTFTLVWGGMTTSGTGTDPDLSGVYRGVNKIQIDTHGVVYAASLGEGIWRSSDGGANWEQVFASQSFPSNTSRTEFALNSVAGATRIYVGDGAPSDNPDATAVYRADGIDTTAASDLTDGNGGTNPGYTELTDTSGDVTSPGYGTYDYCEGQCWYDNFVYSPPGYPNMVYVGGSMDYGAWYAYGGRSVLLSQDAGATFTDQSVSDDGVVGIHPDQHAFITVPEYPLRWVEGSDGGVTYSSGVETNDASPWCDNTYTYFGSDYGDACSNLHQAVPTSIYTANAGLSTLQFQNVAVNPNGCGGPAHHHTNCTDAQLIGGTQDNGTWLGYQNDSSWTATMYGDGGIATFDAPGGNSCYMMNEFYDQYTDGNFECGDPTAWVILSGPFFASGESSEFYKPQISDTTSPGTFFVGLQSVWRTQDYGGDQSTLEANCPEFTTSGADPNCGDFVALGSTDGAGGAGTAGDLTRSALGTRSGGVISALARGSDSATLWAATSTGRLFVTKNADAPFTASVTYTRLDTASSPGRSISGIVVDQSNPNRAWVSYDGFNASTPTTPGHVFQVVYNPSTHTATWTDLDPASGGPLGDLPVTFLARDGSTGTLYAATDFTVLATKQKANGSYTTTWTKAASGMPMVEVPWLAIDQTNHVLYAATHGRGIWSLSLGGAG